VGLLIDQKSGGSHSAKVDFFGKPAETTLSVASLKLKLDPLIVPIFVVRESDGLYELVIHDPVEYIADEIEDHQKKLEAMTLKYNKVIEDIIRKYPSQWFWMHNRWRL
jgi:KDO2-lipid IV(A) lauroyltransferase